MTENEAREIVRDYLNGIYTEQELMLKFDIEKCPVCNECFLGEDLEFYHKWDIGENEEMICEGCRNDQ